VTSIRLGCRPPVGRGSAALRTASRLLAQPLACAWRLTHTAQSFSGTRRAPRPFFSHVLHPARAAPSRPRHRPRQRAGIRCDRLWSGVRPPLGHRYGRRRRDLVRPQRAGAAPDQLVDGPQEKLGQDRQPGRHRRLGATPPRHCEPQARQSITPVIHAWQDDLDASPVAF